MAIRAASEAACILVEAGAGHVRRDGVLVKLTFREAELATAVASQRHAVSVRALGALVYPERDESDAANMVKVYVYRLRRRLGPDFIINHSGGYVLGPRVAVDIFVAQKLISRLTQSGLLESGEVHGLLEIARTLRCEPPAATLEWTWHEPIARLSRRLGHDLAMLLARAALARGALDDALTATRELTYEDPCDEEAWDVLIRTQLRLGQRVAARRGFLSYTIALAKELDLGPSPSLRQMVEAS